MGFGITALLLSSNLHRRYLINDIGALFIPSIDCNQFRLYKEGGKPVGFVSWAYLTSEIDQKYAQGTYNLKYKDWYAGEKLWFLDFAAPFGHAKKIFAELRNELFPNSIGKSVRAEKPGKIIASYILLGKNVVSNRKKSKKLNN
ncbi:MAG: toxin-activating lysine-acyltransferase [Rickettsiales bacterium]